MPASIQEKVYIHSKNVKSRLFGIFKKPTGVHCFKVHMHFTDGYSWLYNLCITAG